MKVQALLYWVDSVSTWVGKAFAWLILVLMLYVCAEVVKRYALNNPSNWFFDLSTMMYGVTFMMWVRWTLPRLRIDQVMTTCLKYCTPIAAAMFLGAVLWTYWFPGGLILPNGYARVHEGQTALAPNPDNLDRQRQSAASVARVTAQQQGDPRD